MPKLADEIRQTRPFLALEEEASLNVIRTADYIAQNAGELLKSRDVSSPQYNILRILRGAGASGLACGAIGERMVTHNPDVTRLLDRLEKRGLVARSRGSDDRRVIVARITPAGLALVNSLDRPMADVHRRVLGHLSEKRLRKLIEMLELVRTPEADG
jgi:DNA-binding MarR family transcriptional regulator